VIKSDSDNLSVRNCVIFNTGGDGIRVQDSANVLLFNNLIYGNAGSGISITGSASGSPDATLVNNTVYGNGIRGLTVGNSQQASPRAFLRNNIIQNNIPTGGDANVKVFGPPPSTVPRSEQGSTTITTSCFRNPRSASRRASYRNTRMICSWTHGS